MTLRSLTRRLARPLLPLLAASGLLFSAATPAQAITVTRHWCGPYAAVNLVQAGYDIWPANALLTVCFDAGWTNGVYSARAYGHLLNSSANPGGTFCVNVQVWRDYWTKVADVDTLGGSGSCQWLPAGGARNYYTNTFGLPQDRAHRYYSHAWPDWYAAAGSRLLVWV